MVVWERRSSAKVQIFFPRVNSLKEHLNQVLTLKYETRGRRQNTNLLNSTRIILIFRYVEICLSKKCCLHFSAIKSTDMKKERTRNLLPAKVGIYGILIFLGHTIIWQLAFSLKV